VLGAEGERSKLLDPDYRQKTSRAQFINPHPAGVSVETSARARVTAGFVAAGLGAVCVFGVLQLLESGQFFGVIDPVIFIFLSVLAVGINGAVGSVTWHVLVVRTELLSIRFRGVVAGVATGIVAPVLWIATMVLTFLPLRAAGVEFTGIEQNLLAGLFLGPLMWVLVGVFVLAPLVLPFNVIAGLVLTYDWFLPSES
jgi:hypothetical protein